MRRFRITVIKTLNERIYPEAVESVGGEYVLFIEARKEIEDLKDEVVLLRKEKSMLLKTMADYNNSYAVPCPTENGWDCKSKSYSCYFCYVKQNISEKLFKELEKEIKN